jgi:glutaredoxin 3
MGHPVRVYTASYCSFCRLAKELLRSRSIAFDEIDVTADASAREWLVAATGRGTVPQIFIGEKPIGGYEELRSLDRAGELARLVGD